MALAKAPRAVREYASSFADPVLLVGCRCRDKALDCCEYDLAVLSAQPFVPKIEHVDGHAVEVFWLKNGSRELSGLVQFEVLQNAALREGLKPPSGGHARKLLNAEGRRSIVKSLMMLKKSRDSRSDTFLSAVWLKVAAYCFTRGILQIGGMRPMPVHELEQLRDRGSTGSTLAAGLATAFEAIGTDYADRPLLLRSKRAAAELLSKRYDTDLILKKADFLEQATKIADCYYYLGMIICRAIEGGEERLLSYPKLVQVALGLSSEAGQLERVGTALFESAAGTLKQ